MVAELDAGGVGETALRTSCTNVAACKCQSGSCQTPHFFFPVSVFTVCISQTLVDMHVVIYAYAQNIAEWLRHKARKDAKNLAYGPFQC